MTISEKTYGAATRLFTVIAAIVAFKYPSIAQDLHPYALGLICLCAGLAIGMYLICETPLAVEKPDEPYDVLAISDEKVPQHQEVSIDDTTKPSSILLWKDYATALASQSLLLSYKRVAMEYRQYSFPAVSEQEQKRAAAVNTALYIARRLNAPNFEVILTPNHEIVIRKHSAERTSEPFDLGSGYEAQAKPTVLN